MNLLGLELRWVGRRRTTAIAHKSTIPFITELPRTTTSPGGGWWRIAESFPGAWQRNVEITPDNTLAHTTVYACVSLIAQDIAKLAIDLYEKDDAGVWQITDNPAYSPVLRKPNHYQTHIKFFEQWMISKLVWGNTYVLKERDARGVVVGLYVLDPQRVRAFVTPDGGVYYALGADALSGVPADIPLAPASELIHDVMVPLFHPLCGVSPLTACGLAALQGLQVQGIAGKLFKNGLQPSGILTAPGQIDDEEARRMQERWMQQYTGPNAGRVAVLGNGLEYKGMSISPVDAQLVDQLKWSAENIPPAFHIPLYKVGIGAPPNVTVEALNIEYYSQCLQNPIESIEALLDEGLGLVKDGQRQTLGTGFDLDDLLKMDTASKMSAAKEAIGSGAMAPNEARDRFMDLGPVEGGDSPYLQQQNYSLAALAKRDAQPDPFAKTPAPTPAPPPPAPTRDIPLAELSARAIAEWRQIVRAA